MGRRSWPQRGRGELPWASAHGKPGERARPGGPARRALEDSRAHHHSCAHQRGDAPKDLHNSRAHHSAALAHHPTPRTITSSRVPHPGAPQTSSRGPAHDIHRRPPHRRLRRAPSARADRPPAPPHPHSPITPIISLTPAPAPRPPCHHRQPCAFGADHRRSPRFAPGRRRRRRPSSRLPQPRADDLPGARQARGQVRPARRLDPAARHPAHDRAFPRRRVHARRAHPRRRPARRRPHPGPRPRRHQQGNLPPRRHHAAAHRSPCHRPVRGSEFTKPHRPSCH